MTQSYRPWRRWLARLIDPIRYWEGCSHGVAGDGGPKDRGTITCHLCGRKFNGWGELDRARERARKEQPDH